MSVPKSKRKESRFEAQHNLYILRKEVTNLVVADFGFSEEKYLEQMERYRAAHRSAENVDEVCARWQEKCEGFKVWYVDEEGRAILDLMRSIQTEFSVANSVFPSRTHAKLMSKAQIKHMKALYKELFGKELIWKSKSHSAMEKSSQQKKTENPLSHSRNRAFQRCWEW